MANPSGRLGRDQRRPRPHELPVWSECGLTARRSETSETGYGHPFDAVPFAPAQVEFVAQYARTDARTVNDDPRCGGWPGLAVGLKLNVGLKNLLI
jgi:hypothetical protein